MKEKKISVKLQNALFLIVVQPNKIIFGPEFRDQFWYPNEPHRHIHFPLCFIYNLLFINTIFWKCHNQVSPFHAHLFLFEGWARFYAILSSLPALLLLQPLSGSELGTITLMQVGRLEASTTVYLSVKLAPTRILDQHVVKPFKLVAKTAISHNTNM